MEPVLALACELDGLHQGDTVEIGCLLCVDQWVMVGEIILAMEKVGGIHKSLRDVGDYFGHVPIDGCLVRHAVHPIPIFGEDREMEGMERTVSHKVSKVHLVL